MAVGKQAFKTPDSSPSSEMQRETPRLVVYFSVEVLIHGIKDWMVISGIDAGRSVSMPLHNISCGFL